MRRARRRMIRGIRFGSIANHRCAGSGGNGRDRRAPSEIADSVARARGSLRSLTSLPFAKPRAARRAPPSAAQPRPSQTAHRDTPRTSAIATTSALAIFIGCGLILFAGCGREANRRAAGGQGEGATPNPPILVVAVPNEPDQLLPPLSRSPASAPLWGWVFPSLVRVEADTALRGRFAGDLAASWQLDDDRKGIRFYLASDRRWDDTTAVGASDVITSYRLYRDPTIGGNWGRRLDEIASVEAPEGNAGMVLFRFRHPIALARALQLASLPLISSAQWAKSASLHPPIGTAGRIPRTAGPFRIDEWKPGDSIRLVRHPFAPVGRIPRADRILIRFVPSGESRGLEVEHGAADIAIDIPSEEAKRLRDEGPQVRLERSGPVEVEALVWNLDHPIWGRWDLRRDVAAHLDMKRLRRAAAGDWEGAPILAATGVFEAAAPPAAPGSAADSASGVEPGIVGGTTESTESPGSSVDSLPSFSFAAYGNLSIEILYDTGDARRERIAVEIAVELDRLGLSPHLAPQSAAECSARIHDRRFDAVVTGFSIPAIRDVGEIWQSAGALNIAGLRSAGVDSLVAQARSASADTIPDAWDRVERRADAQYPFIPIDRRVRIDAVGPAAVGWHADPYDPYGDLLPIERSLH